MYKIILKTLLIYFVCIGCPSWAADVVYITDLEGDVSGLKGAVRKDGLAFINGRLEFTNPNQVLVFGGDLPDNGPNSIVLTEALNDLKSRYPDRVVFIWGNRDINKMQLMSDLPQMSNLSVGPYREHLEEKASRVIKRPIDPRNQRDLELLKTINTPERQLDWWFTNQGAKKALDFHREELSAITGKPVSRKEAAIDYINSILKPNGRLNKFLGEGQLAYIKDGILYDHGGINAENMGKVPASIGSSKKTSSRSVNPVSWVKDLNAWGRSEFKKIKEAVAKGKKAPDYLIKYGDAVWDPLVGKVFPSGHSVVYPERIKENGNFRLPSEEVISWLKKGGINAEVVGHSPAGDAPLPLVDKNFIKLHADNSYGGNSKQDTFIRIVDGKTIEVKGSVEGKTPLSYNLDVLDPSKNTVVGSMTPDRDMHILGKTPDGKFVTFKYGDKHAKLIDVVDEAQIGSAALKAPTFGVNQEGTSHEGALRKNLSERGIPIKSQGDLSTGEFSDGRKPVFFSGGSKYADDPNAEAKIRKILSDLLDNLDPQKVRIVTGGTDNGPEKILHELAAKKGFSVDIGFVSGKAIPSEITTPKNIVVSGDSWDSFMKPALKYIKDNNGAAIFLSGGGIVKQGILDAQSIGVDYYLLDGVSGASSEIAAITPNRSFKDSEDLISLMGRSNDFLKSDVNVGKPPIWSAESVIRDIKKSGKKIVSFVGYSGAGYEDKNSMKKKAREILSRLDPKSTIINLGATEDGIGEIYKIAKEMGFETAGIVSEKGMKYPVSPYADKVYFVDDDTWGGFKAGTSELNPVSKAYVESSDAIYALGGGDVSRDEVLAAQRLGKPVEVISFDMNHALAREKALKAGKAPPSSEFLSGPMANIKASADLKPIKSSAAGLVVDPICVNKNLSKLLAD